jgi:hypothetical protein
MFFLWVMVTLHFIFYVVSSSSSTNKIRCLFIKTNILEKYHVKSHVIIFIILSYKNTIVFASNLYLSKPAIILKYHFIQLHLQKLSILKKYTCQNTQT